MSVPPRISTVFFFVSQSCCMLFNRKFCFWSKRSKPTSFISMFTDLKTCPLLITTVFSLLAHLVEALAPGKEQSLPWGEQSWPPFWCKWVCGPHRPRFVCGHVTRLCPTSPQPKQFNCPELAYTIKKSNLNASLWETPQHWEGESKNRNTCCHTVCACFSFKSTGKLTKPPELSGHEAGKWRTRPMLADLTDSSCPTKPTSHITGIYHIDRKLFRPWTLKRRWHLLSDAPTQPTSYVGDSDW